MARKFLNFLPRLYPILPDNAVLLHSLGQHLLAQHLKPDQLGGRRHVFARLKLNRRTRCDAPADRDLNYPGSS